jgi:iron-sulfur cluster assembly protein
MLEEKGLVETHVLRVFVAGGGCGGMQCAMAFDSKAREDDAVYDQHGLRIVVDPASLFYIDGSHIDYADNPMGGGFRIENPNAVPSCGCGSPSRAACHC